MRILAQRSGSAPSRPAGGVSTDSPSQVQGGGADDPGRATPTPPNDHRAGGRADPWAQEPLGRLPSRGARRPSHIRMCGKLFVPTELVLQKIGLRPTTDAAPRAAS
jgi:hypothetical protein